MERPESTGRTTPATQRIMSRATELHKKNSITRELIYQEYLDTCIHRENRYPRNIDTEPYTRR